VLVLEMISKYKLEGYDENLICKQKLRRFNLIDDEFIMINDDIIEPTFNIAVDIINDNITIDALHTYISYNIEGLSYKKMYEMLYPYYLDDTKMFRFLICSNNGCYASCWIRKINGVLSYDLDDTADALIHDWYDGYCSMLDKSIDYFKNNLLKDMYPYDLHVK
jgi:hypothetical protein